jgi:long-chain acyl-CoA synthetase
MYELVDQYTLALFFVLVVLKVVEDFVITEPDVHPLLIQDQADPSFTRDKESTPVYRSRMTAHGLPLKATPDLTTNTLYAVFQKALSSAPQAPFVAECTTYGTPVYVTYAEFAHRRDSIGTALSKAFGNQPAKVAMYAHNSVNTTLVREVCHAFSWTLVYFDYECPEKNLLQMVRDQAPRILFTNLGLLDRVLTVLQHNTHNITYIVTDESTIPSLQSAQASKFGYNLKSLRLIEHSNETAHIAPHIPPRPTDVAAIVYTEEEGNVLGVEYTHLNFLSQLSNFQFSCAPQQYRLNNSDTVMFTNSFGSVQEANLFYAMVYSTAKGVLLSPTLSYGDVMTCMKKSQPSVVSLSGIHIIHMRHHLNQQLKNYTLTKWGVLGAFQRLRRFKLKEGELNPFPFADNFFLRHLRNELGGKLRTIYSHNVFLSGELIQDISVLLGCNLVRGWQTRQTTGCFSTSLCGDYRLFDHVGPPSPSCEIKLVQTHECTKRGYFVETGAFDEAISNERCLENPKGEIWVRGNNVACYAWAGGERKRAVDGEEWFHTGVIGEYHPSGCLIVHGSSSDIVSTGLPSATDTSITSFVSKTRIKLLILEMNSFIRDCTIEVSSYATLFLKVDSDMLAEVNRTL